MKKLYMAYIRYGFMALLFISGCLPAPVQAATRYERGIATSATLLRMNDAKLEERLSDINELGAVWIRVDFNWALVQPNNADEYDWSLYDRLVKQTTKHGLKILAMVAYTPQWAQEPACAAVTKPAKVARRCNPEHSDTFATFTRAAAIRYKGTNVRGWEIWNEPNIVAFWKSSQGDNKVFVDPERYANLANAAAHEIRHNYPDSVIITGGLAPMYEPRFTRGMRQSDFLAEVLQRLKPELFDGIGIHPYSWPILPSVAQEYNAFYTVDNGRQKFNLRSVMSKHGWGDKEIWGTEYGASTKGLRNAANTPPQNRPDHVTEDMQADIVKQGVQEWYKKENVGPLFVHSDSDQWLSTPKNEGGFGLRRDDGTKKPAYDAFQGAVKW